MGLRNLDIASYKSPSSQVVDFDYEDLSSEIEKKTTVFESAIGDGTYVQDWGNTSGRFPMLCIFHGDDYIDRAKAFVTALLEKGAGTLTHPIYGDVNVIATGVINRTDPLVTNSGEIVFSVTFHETITLDETTETSLAQSFEDLNEASYLTFSDNMKLDDPGDKAAFRYRVVESVSAAKSALKQSSEAVAKVQDKTDDIADSITRGIDTTLGDPLTLARQVQILIGEPRRTRELIKDKITAYHNMALSIFEDTINEATLEAANLFHLNNLIAKAILANMSLAMLDADYETKTEHIVAIDTLMTEMESYRVWYDANYDVLEPSTLEPSQVNTGDGLWELRAVMTGVSARLIEMATTAKTEMRMTLSAERTPLDLCFELYGTVDFDIFDKFVGHNEIVGDEWFLIPKGKDIVWYI